MSRRLNLTKFGKSEEALEISFEDSSRFEKGEGNREIGPMISGS